MNRWPILALSFLLMACDERTPESRADRVCGEGGEVDATVISREFVERRLKAPSTASFPWGNKAKWLGGCEFRVRSYVDAENGFGAQIRTQYSMLVTYLPDEDAWTARDLVMH